MGSITPVRMDNDNGDLATQDAGTDLAYFTVICTIINASEYRIFEYQGCFFKAQAVFLLIGQILRFIPLKYHLLYLQYVHTNIKF